MRAGSSARLLMRLIVDVLLLLGIYTIAFIGLPQWLKSHTPMETTLHAEHGSQSLRAMTTPLTLTRRGFFCSDDSLRYPYNPDTLLNKVHMTMLTIAVPAAVILIVEMLRAGFRLHRFSDMEPQKFSFVGLRIPTLISECYQLMGAYLFGLGLLRMAIVFLKHWTGRLRPYFFDVCQPQLTGNTDCDDDANFGVYIVDYTCSELATVSADLLATLRQSFPSGYVTCAAYALGFLAFYLQSRMRSAHLRLLRISLQFLCAAILALITVERVRSMRNHITDVGAGIILGLVFAAFIAFVVLRLAAKTIAAKRTMRTSTTSGAKRPNYPKAF